MCVGVPAGVYTLDDLRQFGKKKSWCPYFLARHWLAFANVVVYNYQYMIDPKVSQVRGWGGRGYMCLIAQPQPQPRHMPQHSMHAPSAGLHARGRGGEGEGTCATHVRGRIARWCSRVPWLRGSVAPCACAAPTCLAATC